MIELKGLPEIVTPKELADYLKVSEQTVKKALKNGDLFGYKVLKIWRIEKKAVIAWLEKKN